MSWFVIKKLKYIDIWNVHIQKENQVSKHDQPGSIKATCACFTMNHIYVLLTRHTHIVKFINWTFIEMAGVNSPII
jgi:hypothetical protein